MWTPREIRPDHVAIYIRWSTEDQSEGTTLAVQREGCEHYLLSQGWQVTPALLFIDDGYSGGTLMRPAIGRLREAVGAGGIDCVVVYKLDRLSRSVMDTVNLVLGEWEGRTFLKSAREPIDTTSPMGKQFFYMLVSYAEWERSVIKERTSSGRARRAREGKNPGGPVAYGYRLGTEPGVLEVDPLRANVVKQIFSQYLRETGTYRIAGDLNRAGVPSPAGGKWSVNTLLKMLRNPLYAGRVRYGRVAINPRRQRDRSEPWYLKNPEPIEAQSHTPAIVAAEDFERVQRLLDQRKGSRAGIRALSSDYLLTGLARCRQCGHPLVSHSTIRQGAQPRHYSYYACVGKKSYGPDACNGGMIPQAGLDDAVEQALSGFLGSEEARVNFLSVRWRAIEAQVEEAQARSQLLQAALSELQAQARRLNKDYRSGALTAVLYEENRREIDQETAQLQAGLTEAERLAQSLKADLDLRSEVTQIFDLAMRWHELNMPDRKFVLRNLLDEVIAFRAPGSGVLSVSLVWKFGSEPSAWPGPRR